MVSKVLLGIFGMVAALAVYAVPVDSVIMPATVHGDSCGTSPGGKTLGYPFECKVTLGDATTASVDSRHLRSGAVTVRRESSLVNARYWILD